MKTKKSIFITLKTVGFIILLINIIAACTIIVQSFDMFHGDIIMMSLCWLTSIIMVIFGIYFDSLANCICEIAKIKGKWLDEIVKSSIPEELKKGRSMSGFTPDSNN